MAKRYILVNTLTAYGPNNYNRDEVGLPKTITMGGTLRARISSQCQKRAMRTSDICAGVMRGKRSKLHGDKIVAYLTETNQCSEDEAIGIAFAIMQRIGKSTLNGRSVEIEQLIFLSEGAGTRLNDIARKVLTGEIAKVPLGGADPDDEAEDGEVEADAEASAEVPKKKKRPTKAPAKPKNALLPNYTIRYDVLADLAQLGLSADQALFGSMIAEHPEYSIEAAVQLSQAVTVGVAEIEADNLVAVDDMRKSNKSGSAYMTDKYYTSGIYHRYMCIDRFLLERNLNGNTVLAAESIEALIRAFLTVTPRGMATSTAAHSLASYALLEKTNDTPRSLVDAFYRPVTGDMGEAVKVLRERRQKVDEAYGILDAAAVAVDIDEGGKLVDLLAYAKAA